MTTTVIEALSIIESASASLVSIAKENPVNAYVFCNRMKKELEKVEKSTKEEFVSYVQRQGTDLFGQFSAKVTNRKTYNFDENAEWKAKKEELDAMEAKLKQASDAYTNSGVYMVDANGEVLPTVTVSTSEVYSIVQK